MKRALVLALMLATPAWADLNTGLVAHYAFSDNIEDSSSGNHDLTLQNNGADYSFIAGPVGQAISYPGGTGDRNYYTDWTGNDGFTTGGFTLSVWAKRPNTTDGITVITKSGAIEMVFDSGGDGEYRCGVYDSDGTQALIVSTGDAAENTAWHHLLFVFTATGGALYIDGASVGVSNPAGWDANFRNNTNNTFFGSTTVAVALDEFRLYHRNLDAGEIATLAGEGTPPATATPTPTATSTDTPTVTFTPTITNTSAVTATNTATPTVTPTPTATTNEVYKYVREAATGNGTGADWTNAYTVLPNALTRGTVYLVADGAYPGYTFNDANSGTSIITIRKATTSAHGTGTGWDNSYGDGVAQWNGYLYFSTDYFLLDGVTGGGPGSWETGHGFAFDYTGWHSCHLEGARHDITLKHCDFESGGRDSLQTEDQIFYGIGGPYNITIQYCWMHDVRVCQLTTRSGHDYLIEYNKFSRNGGGGITSHREFWSGSNESDVVFRYNFLEDISNSAFIGLVNGTGNADNWEIYGNLFTHSTNLVEGDNQVSPAIILTKYSSPTFIVARNWKFFNNTIANINGQAGLRIMETQVLSGVSFQARNNVWANNYGYPVIHSTSDTIDINYSYYVDNRNASDQDLDVAAAAAEVNSISGTGSPFVGSGNYALSAAIAGSTLEAAYNTDMLGNTRGADGTWDMGALEFNSSTPYTATPTPTQTKTATATPTVTQTPVNSYTPTPTVATPTPTRTETPLIIKVEGAESIVIQRIFRR